MDQDRVKGTVKELGGTVKRSIGELTGDSEWEAGGAVDQLTGRAQDLYGKAKDGLQDVVSSAKEPGGPVDQLTGRAQDLYGKAKDGLQGVVSTAQAPGGAVDQITGRAQEFYGKARDGVQDAVKTAQQPGGAVDQVTGRAQGLYAKARDGLQDVVSNAGGYAGEAYDRGDDYARRGARLARREIKDYPLAAVLMAGAVGYLLAMSLHGRR